MSRIIVEYRTADNIDEVKKMELPEDAICVTIAGFGVKMDTQGLEIDSPDDSITIKPIAANIIKLTKEE